ncbi:hypothetical protein TRAPUB_11515 [Trametes pubescens]|uniref:Uncharacterized protein n=1 Tax=Trametes pubescens TaxID=154538 RepID=A0A1M2VWF3_TRAPU|nr:hypothetical protein TRAPUB_11515 [Trametes pubescens]
MSDNKPDSRPASRGIVPTENKCQVIPPRGEPPCTRAGRLPRVRNGEVPRPERGESRILCREHDNERQRVYFKYKSAAAEANRLGMRIAQDPDHRRPAERLGREQVDAGIALREKYAHLIDDELRERESHRKRFVAEGRAHCMLASIRSSDWCTIVDAGHAAWLKRRQDVRATNDDVLSRLRQRRDALIAKGVYGEARKREQEEARQHHEDVERMRQAMIAMRLQEEADKQHAQKQRTAREETEGEKGREETRHEADEARRHDEEVEMMRQRMVAMKQEEEADKLRAQRQQEADQVAE